MLSKQIIPMIKISLVSILFFQASLAFLDEAGKNDLIDGVKKVISSTYHVPNWQLNGIVSAYKVLYTDLQLQEDVNSLPCITEAEQILAALEQDPEYNEELHIAMNATDQGFENANDIWVEFRKFAAHKMSDIVESRMKNYSCCRDPKQFLQSVKDNEQLDIRTNAMLQIQAAQSMLYKIRQINREYGNFKEYVNLPNVEAIENSEVRFLNEEGKKDLLQGIKRAITLSYEVDNWDTNGLIAAFKILYADMQFKDVNSLPCVAIASGFLDVLEKDREYWKALLTAKHATNRDDAVKLWKAFRQLAARKMSNIMVLEIKKFMNDYKRTVDPSRVLEWFSGNAQLDVRTAAILQIQAAQVLLYKIRQINRECGNFKEYIDFNKLELIKPENTAD